MTEAREPCACLATMQKMTPICPRGFALATCGAPWCTMRHALPCPEDCPDYRKPYKPGARD